MAVERKAVIVISSHVARGSVGNRAAVFALEVLCHSVWAVPTITLPFHPGHGPATRIVAPADSFRGLLDDLLASPWIGEVGAILTGYMADAEQPSAVARFIAGVRGINRSVIHVCDPVLGDDGALYVTEATALAVRDHLVAGADLVTPNRFELSWLSGRDVDDAPSAFRALEAVKSRHALVTSLPGFMKGNIGNLLVGEAGAVFAEHREIANPPNGPGDLTAAIFLSHHLSGMADDRALQQTSASVFEIIAGAARRGADELMLERDAGSITRPRAMVSMRNLSVALGAAVAGG